MRERNRSTPGEPPRGVAVFAQPMQRPASLESLSFDSAALERAQNRSKALMAKGQSQLLALVTDLQERFGTMVAKGNIQPEAVATLTMDLSEIAQSAAQTGNREAAEIARDLTKMTQRRYLEFADLSRINALIGSLRKALIDG